ncbi:MAG: hypothetical protein ACFFCQ_07280 [Promethearchaeota archaeon]
MSDSSHVEDRVHFLLSELTIPNLKDICRKKKLRGFSKLKKADLVDFIVDSLVESESLSELESLAESVVNFQAYEMLNIKNRIIDLMDSDSKFVGTFVPRGGQLNTCTIQPALEEVICSCADYTDFSAICSHQKSLLSLAIAAKKCSPELSANYKLSDEFIDLANEFLEERASVTSEKLEKYLVDNFAFTGRAEKAAELSKKKFQLSFSPTRIEGHYLGKTKETGQLKPVFVINFDRLRRTITHNCPDFLNRTSRMAKACKHLIAVFLLWGDDPDTNSIWQSLVSCRWRFESP